MRSSSSPRAVSIDDRGRRRTGAQRAAHVEPAGAGEHQVEHDGVRPGRGGGAQGPVAVAGEVDPVAGLAEVPGDDVADGRVVVHHEHPGGHRTSVATRRVPQPAGAGDVTER